MPNLQPRALLVRALAVISGAWLATLAPLAAQSPDAGSIVGRVISTETGAGVSGATVRLRDSDAVATSDLDGAFRLTSVPSGSHALFVSRPTFRDSVVTDVNVAPGGVATANVPLESAVATLGDVITMDAFVVQSAAAEGSGLTLLAARQRALAISDAIGADTFTRLDVGDAAEAMGKVTGASVVDGKYVLIRGLGDRYSNTLLNNTAVPSADPDRRAVQMDQFPASLLESIVTSKSFTPDQPGGFSGGSVNLRTKSFSDHFFVSSGVTVATNSQVTGKDVLSIPGGGSDWQGRDDGTRALPDGIPAAIPSQSVGRSAAQTGNFGPAEELDRASRLFHNASYFPRKTTGDLNFSTNFATGNRHDFANDRRLGYIVSLTYGRSNTHYTDGYSARYSAGSISPDDPSFVNGRVVFSPRLEDYGFAADFTQNPDVPGGEPQFGVTESTQRVDWGTYAQVAFKPSLNHEIALRFLRNQSADDRVKRGVGESSRSDAGRLFEIYELLYTERSVSSLQLAGESLFPGWNNTRLEWRVSRARSTQDQPDYRSLSYFWDFANQQYAAASGVGNNRFFRDLVEDSDEIGADLIVPFQVRGSSGSFKFGGTWQDGARTYRERRFRWSREANQRELIENYPNPVGIVSRTANSVTFGNTISELPNNLVNYDGEQAISAVYAMVDVELTDRWRAVVGVRAEQTEISTSPAATGSSFRAATIDQTDYLPAVSLIHEFRPDMNLRAAFGRTLARPLYRELADIRVEDVFNDEFFAGNPDLQLTNIDNYDLRWEWFPRGNEILAASIFHKSFRNPIEVVSVASIGSIQPQNLERGEVQGLELEARVGLDRFGRWLSSFSLGGNVSWITSEVSIPAVELAEIRRTFPDAAGTRELHGQSNFIANLDVTFQQPAWGTTLTLAGNYVGRRLSLVTNGALPDVYEEPAPELDFILSQRLSAHWRLKFTAKNLLDSAREKTLTHAGRDYFYERSRRGRDLSLGLSYLFE